MTMKRPNSIEHGVRKTKRLQRNVAILYSLSGSMPPIFLFLGSLLSLLSSFGVKQLSGLPQNQIVVLFLPRRRVVFHVPLPYYD